MSAHHTRFEMYIDKDKFRSWDHFFDEIHQSDTFVDGIVIIATVIFSQRSIIIHQHQQRSLFFKTSFTHFTHDQMHMVYNSSNLHYSSIWSSDGDRLYIDKKECISI